MSVDTSATYEKDVLFFRLGCALSGGDSLSGAGYSTVYEKVARNKPCDDCVCNCITQGEPQ